MWKDSVIGWQTITATQLQLDRAALSPLVRVQFQEELRYKVWLRWKESNAEGLVAYVAFPSLWLFLVCERGLCKQCLLDSHYEFGPANHKESFLASIFLLGINNV